MTDHDDERMSDEELREFYRGLVAAQQFDRASKVEVRVTATKEGTVANHDDGRMSDEEIGFVFVSALHPDAHDIEGPGPATMRGLRAVEAAVRERLHRAASCCNGEWPCEGGTAAAAWEAGFYRLYGACIRAAQRSIGMDVSNGAEERVGKMADEIASLRAQLQQVTEERDTLQRRVERLEAAEDQRLWRET